MSFVAEVASQQHQPGAAIPPIREPLLRIDPSGSVLTSNHLFLVRLALQTRCFTAITELLDKPVLYIPAKEPVSYTKFLCEADLPAQSYVTIKSGFTSKLKPLDVLEYFYYAGSVYIGLHKWDAALEMLEDAITYPVNEGGVSLVMVEAYKKWLLVGILQYGRVLQLPQTTSAPAAKAYHIIAKPYEALASIFETGSAARLKSEAEFGRQLWTDDAADIMSLTTSAETGVKLTSIKQIEDLIQSMIADGTLPATMIRDQSGHAVLAFSPTGPVLSETQVQIDLVASTRRIQSLAKQIKVTDRVLTHDKRYLDSAQRAKSKAKKVGGVTVDPMDWNTVIEDEDIMTEMY
ncbi:cd38d9f6-c3d7-435e-adbc-142e9d4496d3 [Sclerotinia trifoliorum]|uniref:Cd38d9f6-c3d7-435e-adbc-142e9d4496d3 n=1 Tax=Sclerotinia trifoliorum TaxID=28548 RepID=A0A8H2W3M7_9HELO|nr:cd38d9f6-c3d7-435e-adbc-142e9d4496d3 [Sclerotinia trifoliorum]